MVRGDEAYALTGIPSSHGEVFQATADATRCMISSRAVGKYATGLIMESYASKGFHNKAKSCNWGPMAGFYAKKANPPLHVTPLVKEKTGPRLAFRIGMGVRGADQNWKRQLNRLIQDNQPAIDKILLDYGVPLLDENDRPIGPETATKAQ